MTPGDYAYQIVNETDGHPVRFGKQSIRIELRQGTIATNVAKEVIMIARLVLPLNDMNLEWNMMMYHPYEEQHGILTLCIYLRILLKYILNG